MTQRTARHSWIAIAGVALLLLTGCAAEPGIGASDAGSATSSGDEKAADTPAHSPEEPAPADTPREQAESCDWDAPAISSASLPGAPASQEGELATVLIGAWQHTHYDTGAGYEPLDKDIRYVFPSTARLLYCQHVPGITDHAENAADFTLNGETIELPGGAPGYIVAEWNDDTMVWINRLDDSRYLLQRR